MRVKRRSFIRSTGILSGSFAVGLAFGSWNESFSKDRFVSIGVIGTGSRGSGLIRLMRSISQLKVIACCDIIPLHLKNAIKHAESNAKAYSDYRDLLENENIEAVIIATPLYLHAKMALDALDAGKHIYCEKTMAYNPSQAIQMIQRFRESQNLTFQVGHQYHSSELYEKVVELVQNGYIGKVTGFECQWNRNGDWRRKVPDHKYERIINWRMYREYSCGLLAELSSHQIDFVNWIIGTDPISVVGTGGIDYWKDGRETYDNTHVIFDYPDGIKASFTCNTANAFGGYQIKILGDQATIIVKPDKAWIYPEYKELNQESVMIDGVTGATKSTIEQYGAIPIKANGADPTKRALLKFYENITQDKIPLSNIYTGAKVSFAVNMGLRAMKDKQMVEWNKEYNI